MRVLIYTFGTQGDIQPYVALAGALGRAGHEAVICTAGGFRGLVESHGVDFVPMGDEMLELVNHSRPVTIAWHRKQGPAFLGAFMRSVKEPEYRIPHEIEGISRQHALNAMSVVFEEHGSPSLRAAIQEYGMAVLYACGRYDTVEKIVQALNQLPIHAAQDTVQ